MARVRELLLRLAWKCCIRARDLYRTCLRELRFPIFSLLLSLILSGLCWWAAFVGPGFVDSMEQPWLISICLLCALLFCSTLSARRKA